MGEVCPQDTRTLYNILKHIVYCYFFIILQ